MIAYAGLLMYKMGYTTPLKDTGCTQRLVSFIPILFYHNMITLEKTQKFQYIKVICREIEVKKDK